MISAGVVSFVEFLPYSLLSLFLLLSHLLFEILSVLQGDIFSKFLLVLFFLLQSRYFILPGLLEFLVIV